MSKILIIFTILLCASGCMSNEDVSATKTSAYETALGSYWTDIPTTTFTPSSTFTPRPTRTTVPSLTPTNTKTPFISPTVTPTPVVVSFNNVCDIEGRVKIYGKLVVGNLVSQRIEPQSYILSFYDSESDSKIIVHVKYADFYEPVRPNQMAPLPSPFEEEDIRIRTANGTYIGNRSFVWLVGFTVPSKGVSCVLEVEEIIKP